MLFPPGVAMSMWHCSNAIRFRNSALLPSWIRIRGMWSTPLSNRMSQNRSVLRRRRHRMPASRSSDTQCTNCCRRLSATRRSPDHFFSHSRAAGGGVGCIPARRRLRRNTSRQCSIGFDSGSNAAAAAASASTEDSSLNRSFRCSGVSVGISGSKKRTARLATAPVCSGWPSWIPSSRSSTNSGIWFSSRIMSLRMACMAPRMAKTGSCRE
uniref:Uncharacterized protein n=1 Tax=Triticum urartu TaxID=4572 RepID=A0A8R7PHE1_TRIUA